MIKVKNKSFQIVKLCQVMCKDLCSLAGSILVANRHTFTVLVVEAFRKTAPTSIIFLHSWTRLICISQESEFRVKKAVPIREGGRCLICHVSCLGSLFPFLWEAHFLRTAQCNQAVLITITMEAGYKIFKPESRLRRANQVQKMILVLFVYSTLLERNPKQSTQLANIPKSWIKNKNCWFMNRVITETTKQLYF